MSRPADAVFQVTEKLRVYWTTLEEHEDRFEEGDRKKFYELVQECVDQLLVKGVEQKWETNWRKVPVWKIRDLDPGEPEKRIREEVRWRIRAARRLKGWEWWATEGIKEIGDNVDAWFGEATDPAKAAKAVAGVPPTERVVSVSSAGERALRERVAELTRENGELEEENEALEGELAKLRAAGQRLQKQLEGAQFTVRNLRQQVALLEKMGKMPCLPAADADRQMHGEGSMSGLEARLHALKELVEA